MARFSNPILFSEYFEIDAQKLDDAGLLDPFLNVDTPLFVDPVLLQYSQYQSIKVDAYNALKDQFQKIIRLLAISESEKDPAWKAAQKGLNLQEAPFNGLGYGTTDRSGSSRPDDIRDTILRTAKQIITLGSKDPDMISTMGLFEENVGPDTISDLTSRIIQPQLAEITLQFCQANEIPTRKTRVSGGMRLPHFRTKKGKLRAIVLIPSDIVRELPIANDWSDVQNVISENEMLRDRVNEVIGDWFEMTIKDRKQGLREALFHSAELIDIFISTLKENKTFYDPKEDSLGYFKLREMLLQNKESLVIGERYDLSKGIDEILRVVHATLDMFTHHIEKANLWEELWIGDKPKKERAAQLMYFAIADSFCKANNIDISPEANMGGGPIDFKFSKGYSARVLVEMKKSNGAVVSGYKSQLKIYKEASRTNYGIFVIIDVGNMGKKLSVIEGMRDERKNAGQIASEIRLIDGSKKDSASKRK